MEWVVRAGEARPEYLVSGYGPHRAVAGLYGLSVQYAPGKTVDELAHAGRFPNAQISYATDDSLASALQPLGRSMKLISSPGQGYHHTFAVVYDASGVMLTRLPLALAIVISQTFQRRSNPLRARP
ncbi:MAG TPA: hypothetical protein VF120_18120 [Ktedonobacterales bacterium]